MHVTITYGTAPEPPENIQLFPVYALGPGFGEFANVSIPWPDELKSIPALHNLRRATLNYLSECLTRLTVDELLNYANPAQAERTVAA